MKTIGLEQMSLETYIKDVQHERVVITRNGKPVALIIGVEGLDEEQLQLGSSAKFWKLVEKWRKEETIDRAELERRLEAIDRRKRQKRKSAAQSRKVAKM